MNTTPARSLSRCATASLLICTFTAMGTTAASEPFPIRDGDRIVLVGSTFIERDVRYGCIETLMTAHFRDSALTFRNLGWSGDDVFGVARASFDPVPKGYERLINQIRDATPSVLVMSFGQNESFKGADGLEEFVAGYTKLLDDVAPLNARIVLISPTLQFDLGAPLPDPAEHNEDLRMYVDAIAGLAAKRNLRFIDMTTALSFPNEIPLTRWTDNGVHFTEAGYWRVASTIIEALGYPAPRPDREKLAAIQRVVNEKNRLFFLKWRPQNETYLTGFRAYEQGKNAAEIPLFDPLVSEQEKKIFDLRVSLEKNGVGK